MANQIVQLTDKDENNIFPIAGGMASDSITTAMLQDGVVTTAKLASNAVNSAIKTTSNLGPSDDTVSAWLDLFGTAGFYVTGYSGNHFTNQPNNYGVLITYHGGNTIIQIFQALNGTYYIRSGNLTGWYGASGASGIFRSIGSILYGTTAPSSSLGQNGDIYVRYSA